MMNDPNFAVPCPAGTCDYLTCVIDRQFEDFVSVHCEHCNITVRHDHRWYFNKRIELKNRFNLFG